MNEARAEARIQKPLVAPTLEYRALGVSLVVVGALGGALAIGFGHEIANAITFVLGVAL